MADTDAPYALGLSDNGHTLTATYVQPQGGERALAERLNKAFAVAASQPNAWNSILPGLLEIANLGLAGEQRDLAAAKTRFDALELDKFIGNPAASAPPRRGAYLVGGIGTGDIELSPNAAGPEPTEEQLTFLGELEKQERLVKQVYAKAVRNPGRRQGELVRSVDRLIRAGELGLSDAKPNVRIAKLASAGVLLDALAEHGLAIRSAYLFSLGRAYLVLTVTALAAAWLYGHLLYGSFAPPHAPAEAVLPKLQLTMLSIAIVSLAAGAWLSAVIFVEPDSPEVISSISSQTLGPGVRAACVIGAGFLLLLLLHKKAVVFALGVPGASGSRTGYSTEAVLTQLSSAIITGMLLGVGARALPDAVVGRAASLVSALSGK